MLIGEYIRQTLLRGPSYSGAMCRSYREKYNWHTRCQSFRNQIYYLKLLGLVKLARKEKIEGSSFVVHLYKITKKERLAPLNRWIAPKKYLS